jgi:hypothetical protein
LEEEEEEAGGKRKDDTRRGSRAKGWNRREAEGDLKVARGGGWRKPEETGGDWRRPEKRKGNTRKEKGRNTYGLFRVA